MFQHCNTGTQTAAIRSNQVNVARRTRHQEGPSFDHVSYSHLSRPAGVRGHCLMSFRVESWGGLLWPRWKAYRNRVHIAHTYTTHERTHLTTPLWPLCPFRLQMDMTWWPVPPQSEITFLLRVPPSLTASIPRASLLHPGRSPSSAGTRCYHHIHKAIVG